MLIFIFLCLLPFKITAGFLMAVHSFSNIARWKCTINKTFLSLYHESFILKKNEWMKFLEHILFTMHDSKYIMKSWCRHYFWVNLSKITCFSLNVNYVWNKLFYDYEYALRLSSKNGGFVFIFASFQFLRNSSVFNPLNVKCHDDMKTRSCTCSKAKPQMNTIEKL